MATAECHTPPARQRWFLRFFVVATAAGTASTPLWRAVHQSGSFVLVTAAWGAVLTFAIVSYVRFTRRERRRETAKAAVWA
ncbi:hypothetical protein [Candidatus Poriferisodalis sp.]|uniref:hypothetical protein n=1 Tax=Candidatus Poriferisodalis sp. TaxID=3101277 RepID=UPI003B515A06